MHNQTKNSIPVPVPRHLQLNTDPVNTAYTKAAIAPLLLAQQYNGGSLIKHAC